MRYFVKTRFYVNEVLFMALISSEHGSYEDAEQAATLERVRYAREDMTHVNADRFEVSVCCADKREQVI